MAYRNALLKSGLSLAELLCVRKLRTTTQSFRNYKQVSKNEIQVFKDKDKSTEEGN